MKSKLNWSSPNAKTHRNLSFSRGITKKSQRRPIMSARTRADVAHKAPSTSHLMEYYYGCREEGHRYLSQALDAETLGSSSEQIINLYKAGLKTLEQALTLAIPDRSSLRDTDEQIKRSIRHAKERIQELRLSKHDQTGELILIPKRSLDSPGPDFAKNVDGIQGRSLRSSANPAPAARLTNVRALAITCVSILRRLILSLILGSL